MPHKLFALFVRFQVLCGHPSRFQASREGGCKLQRFVFLTGLRFAQPLDLQWPRSQLRGLLRVLVCAVLCLRVLQCLQAFRYGNAEVRKLVWMICDLFVTAVLRRREEHAHLHHKAGWATDQGILLLELAMLGLNSYNSNPATKQACWIYDGF